MSQSSYHSSGCRNGDERSDRVEQFSRNVAEHYNNVEQVPLRERKRSRIIDLRDFNNGTKDFLLSKAFNMIKPQFPDAQYNVLDLGCGKGGDLLKYSRKNIKYYFGADIADVSIEQAKERYSNMRATKRLNFDANFRVVDLTRDTLRDAIPNRDGETPLFHLASAQFCIHYSYESMEQALKFIANARENLLPRGVFTGTYPDGSRLYKLASANDGVYEVNDTLKVKFDNYLTKPRLFGTKYDFYLKEVVDCPEFVIHPSVMKCLFEANGFLQVFDKSFEEFVNDTIRESGENLKMMKKTYNNFRAVKSVTKEETDSDADYKHVCRYMKGDRVNDSGLQRDVPIIGTVRKSIWDLASIYRVFCYRKIN